MYWGPPFNYTIALTKASTSAEGERLSTIPMSSHLIRGWRGVHTILVGLLLLTGGALAVASPAGHILGGTERETLPPDRSSETPYEPEEFSGNFTPPSSTPIDNLPLPPAPDGNGYSLLQAGDATLVLRPTPRSPLSVAQGCLGLLRACYEPGIRNMAGCFANVPPCNTETPWLEDSTCCPRACGARYQTLRSEGKSDIVASGEALLRSPSCVPGLDAQLGE